MKATRIDHQILNFILSSGEGLVVILDVWKIPPPEDKKFPDGIKFSFLAFKSENPEERVLFDCHPPKGPHVHIGDIETDIEWSGLEAVVETFWKMVEKKFGNIQPKNGEM